MADSIFKQMGVVIRNSLDSLKTELTTEINMVNTNITSKLDNLQNYTLPVATNTILGGVKAGDNVTIDANGVISSSGSVTSVAGKTGVITLVKSDVGLNNVDNTSDLNKPVSTATQTALNNKVDKVAGKQLSTEDYTTIEKTKLSGIESGAQVNTVTSVAGKTGVVTLVKGDVGLGNVDNTSDASKNVLSASKLTTAITIGGVSFDGTANINLPGVNTAGNQNTTGNSATATKLATPVKINNKLFDGSANINLEEDAMVVKEKVVNLTGDNIQTSLGSVFIKTITNNTTLTLTTSYNTGEVNSFILELINGGNYTINWWSDVKWNGGVAPKLTNNGKDILGFYSYGSPRVTVGVVLSKDVK